MNYRTLPRLLSLLVGAFLPLQSPAQQAPPPPRPERLVSPEIDNGKVIFRLKAPKAQQVVVRLGGRKESVPLQRNDDGVWTASVDGLTPEIYDYQFEVDGFASLDPSNPWIKQGLRPTSSLFEIAGNPAEFWAFQDVPHGSVTIHPFLSKSLNLPRTVHVYTPPGYDPRAEQRYPALYLLHGSGDRDDGWTVVGRANLIADNLIHAGQAKPMIIVMPDGTYPRSSGHEADFETDLLQVIVPLIEKIYRVEANGANRALAGLSMGGFQTLDIGVKHLDQFAWLGVFSAGIREDYAGSHEAYLNTAAGRISLLWIGIGQDDFLLSSEKRLESLLNERHIKYTSQISDGGHTWPNWRHYLHTFLPLLFQPDNQAAK